VRHNRQVDWQTTRLGAHVDLRAPDGSEIRLLVGVAGGSMVHCTLRPGQVTQAVRHRTVAEVWYCVRGVGQVWRRAAEDPTRAEIVDVRPGTALSIPLGTEFQFRASGSQPFEVVITTIPPWPGADEAVAVEGAWPPT
jgi:mannose-6-phosphate isomerase-like protein (cupin superfamily)